MVNYGFDNGGVGAGGNFSNKFHELDVLLQETVLWSVEKSVIGFRVCTLHQW